MNGEFRVCVPARDEAGHIGTLIAALAEQTVAPVPLTLCANNCRDDTAAAARAAAGRTAGRVALTIVEREFEPALAHAGSARRAAMEAGAQCLRDDGLLISTDADCRPPPAWIEANLANAGADRIVGGRIELDPDEDVPPALLALRARFDRYWSTVREIEDAIDPQSWDPAPRHGDHTGASLAMCVSLYRRAGGVPPIASGEDRALVAAAIAAGGRLVHPVSVWTRASARTAGRAAGGMALDMRRWIAAEAAGAAPVVPDFRHWRARAEWRATMRRRDPGVPIGAAEAMLDPMPCDMVLPECAAS